MQADMQAWFVESRVHVCILCAYLCHWESQWKKGVDGYPCIETDL